MTPVLNEAPKTEPRAIVGIASCGKIQGAVVDDPEHKNDTAKFVSRMVKRGLRIETWTCEAVRQGTFCFGCDVCRPKRQRKAKAVSLQTEATL